MKKTLPVLLLKRLLLLPNQEVKLELNNHLTNQIISLASSDFNKEVLIVCPKNELEEIPDVDDLSNVGVIALIKSNIELPNGHHRIKLMGLRRVSIEKYFNELDHNILKCQ